MRGKKLLDRLGRGDIGTAGSGGLQELEKLVAVAGREPVGGMGDDVGMNVLGEVEADGEAAWIGLRRVVRDGRKASGV